MQSLAYSMSGDDQRRIAFCSTHNNVFANSFPLTLAPDPSMRFNLPGTCVHIAMARKLGAPIPQLLPYVGTTVRSEGRSQKVRVDQYGNGVASAPGVKGGHVSAARAQLDQLRHYDSGTKFRSDGKGNNRNNTCNGANKGSLNVGAATKVKVTMILKRTYKR